MASIKELHGKSSFNLTMSIRQNHTHFGLPLLLQMLQNYRCIILEAPYFQATIFNHNIWMGVYVYLIKLNLIFFLFNLQIRVNDFKTDSPLFTTGVIGKDNTIARHGIHGLYWLYSIDIPGTLLLEGVNTVFLTQAMSSSPVQGLMYDYIRLEGPSSSTST